MNAVLGTVCRLAQDHALLVFDFDGTLAPIVRDRQAASMRPRTRELLAQVAERYPTAVLSGRSVADVRRRLGRVRLWRVVGNHGAEPSPGMRAAARRMRAVKRRLRGQLAGVPGVEIEDKVYSLAVHYRRNPSPWLARRRIRQALSTEVGVRIVGGKRVVNVLPDGLPGKGEAVLRLLERSGAERAVFVGDDTTDEEVFRLKDARVVGVRVGKRKGSAARYTMKSQREIDELLERLLSA